MDEDKRYTGEDNLNGGQPGDEGMEVQDTYVPDEGYTPDPEFTPDQEDTTVPVNEDGQDAEDASGQQSDVTDTPEQQAQDAEIPGDGSAAPQDRPHDFDQRCSPGPSP